MFDRQEAFNIMVLGLNEQKAVSIGVGTLACKYRGRDGLKCAVGMLIPDDVYSPEFEGLSADSHTISRAVGTEPYSSDATFLYTCQNLLHDNQRPGGWDQELFENEVAYIASQYDLTNPLKENTDV